MEQKRLDLRSLSPTLSNLRLLLVLIANVKPLSFFFCRYSLTNAGCELAEKLETVTGESLSPGTSSAPPFTVDCTQSPPSCHSDDKTRERKKPVQLVCVDEDEPEDLPMKSASGYSFTRIKETREEGIKTR